MTAPQQKTSRITENDRKAVPGPTVARAWMREVVVRVGLGPGQGLARTRPGPGPGQYQDQTSVRETEGGGAGPGRGSSLPMLCKSDQDWASAGRPLRLAVFTERQTTGWPTFFRHTNSKHQQLHQSAL